MVLHGNPVDSNTQKIRCIGNGKYYIIVTDEHGCTDLSDTLAVRCDAGISEIISDNYFSIYPNPATDNITLKVQSSDT